MGLTAVVLSGFALAAMAPWLHRKFRGPSGWVFALLPAGITAYLAQYIGPISRGEPVTPEYHTWASDLGVSLSFHLDGLSLLFALLIAGTGTLVLIYSAGYLGAHPQAGRFYAYLLMFMASMLGLVLADNVLALFIFWELTSISSFLLIGYHHDRESARSAAWQALLVTGGGGLTLMAGLLLLAAAGGSFEMSDLLTRGDTVRTHDYYLPVLVLVLVGAATKSAQFPFHFWLPSAMEAPTPVSAYLHSATMVKAGVYLLARTHPVLGGTAEWQWSVTAVGAVTMVVAGVLSVIQFDLKRILAYSTVSALGTLTLLLGLGVSGAVKAAVVFLVAHALYKGALFMVAGSVDHETGTRDVRELGGLWRVMPYTAAAGLIAGLSLAGLGPFLSFIGKEALFEAVWESPDVWFVLAPAAVFAGALFVVVAGLVVLGPFFGPRREALASVHEGPVSLWLGPVLLSLAGLVAGLWPAWVASQIVSPAVTAILGQPYPVELALWHGVNAALVMSIISLILGAAVYALRGRLGRVLRGGSRLLDYGPEAWYAAAVRWLNTFAWTTTHVIQSGYLRYYIFTVLVTTTALVGYTLVRRAGLSPPGDWRDVKFYEAGLLGITVLAALMAVLVRSYLTAIAALGVVGYSVALMFVLFGAPDLAMTQFLIETLTVILFLLVFVRRRQPADLSRRPARLRDAGLAIAVGAVMAALVLVATAEQRHRPSISRFFAERSWEDAHGRNIVNVILVDFRALDTLGEITVLAAAGVGVYGLLRLRLGRRRPTEEKVFPEDPDIPESTAGGGP
jgi:multicomponent Na+:H+ antiporter subunit A